MTGQPDYLPRAALGCITNFSFLRGASHPHEMVGEAARLGWQQIALADLGSCGGLVRAWQASRTEQISLICGALIPVQASPDLPPLHLAVYVTSLTGWQSLCRLLSTLNMVQPGRGSKPALAMPGDFARLAADTQLILHSPPDPDTGFFDLASRLDGLTEAPLHIGACLLRDGCDEARLARLADFSRRLSVPFVALAGALYHQPARRPLADALSCIRRGVQLEEAGLALSRNAERALLSPAEMARRWQGWPEALQAADALADRCHFQLDEIRYHYPEEITSGGRSPQEELEWQVWQGARQRWPDGLPPRVTAYIEKELALIAKLQFAPYFLTVFDIVRFARSRRILCQGRGSAANSAICYCLGITAVDPARFEPLFERFVSEARGEPPDIDVDFEHERREEVIQYIYGKYGRHRAGLAAAVITYRSRSALVELAKAFGLSRDVQQALSAQVWGREKGESDNLILAAAGLDSSDPALQNLLKLVRQLKGFPRHLSQHSGGFVIARDRLDQLCVIRPAAMDGRSIIEWDKDDLDALGLLKVDVLALGMLSCLRRCFDLLARHYHLALGLASVPPEDRTVYDMLCRAESVGVFQVESRAQMAMLPRLQPRCFHDLVVQVAIVRPGPIQGDMVHPYLRRRAGLERVDYPSEALRGVLERTLGVPLFQEQAMRIAIVGAGFTGSEADQLRRAMASFRKDGRIHEFHDRMIEGMVERGYDRDFASRCFRQIEGFGTYGFPESHAASFALLVYISAYVKRHYPDVFICALLNAQPMGFYGPAQLVAEAKRAGIEVRPVDVSHSFQDCTLEPTDHARHALRLGFRQVKGLSAGEAGRIAASRGAQGYESLADILRRADISIGALEALGRADGFGSLGLDRRTALWELRRLRRQKSHDLPLFAHAERRHASLYPPQAEAALPATQPGEAVMLDYQATSLSLKAHPMRLLAEFVEADRWQLCSAACQARDGQRLRLIGLVAGRQRPGTAKGTVFVTLEDEAGSLNVIVWPKLVARDRQALLGAHIMGVTGRVQQQDGVLHLIAESLYNGDHYLRRLQPAEGAARPPLKSRDFH